MNRRYDALTNLFHSLFQVVLAFSMLGVYFSWLDDLYPTFNLTGRVLSTPTADFNLAFHTHLGYLYLWLYKAIPVVNWFGWIMAGYTVLFVFCINFVLLELCKSHFRKPWRWFLMLSYAVFGAILIENVFLLNYTRTALLLCLFSLLAIILILRDKEPFIYRKRLITAFIVLFLIGLSIRFTVVIPMLGLVGVYSFLLLKPRAAVRFTGLLILASALFVGVSWQLQGKQNQAEIIQDLRLVKILDGMDGPMPHQFATPRDSVKAMALYYWIISDRDTLLNPGFLDSFESHPDKQSGYFGRWVESLKEEIAKAKGFYSSNYLGALNWWWKSIGLFLISIAIPLVFFWSKRATTSQLLKAIGFIGVCTVFILGITIFLKMEDRVLNPLLIFLLIAVWTLMGYSPKSDLRMLYIAVIALFTILTGMRIPGYVELSKQRRSDLKIKSRIQDEMKSSFAGKTVLFDLYSTTLLETHPMQMRNFPQNWLTSLEVWNFNIEAHQKRLTKAVGCTDWPCFFQRISERPDDFVFVWLADRVKIAEDYNRLVYGYDLKFRRDERHTAIDDLEYSFLWMPLDLDYFTIDPDYPQRDSL